jgi:hypothetical protein
MYIDFANEPSVHPCLLKPTQCIHNCQIRYVLLILSLRGGMQIFVKTATGKAEIESDTTRSAPSRERSRARKAFQLLIF